MDPLDVLIASKASLSNSLRILQNTFSLVLDTPIKGNDAEAVAEVKAFLLDLKGTIERQLSDISVTIALKERGGIEPQCITGVVKE